jgi:hypothetical protein
LVNLKTGRGLNQELALKELWILDGLSFPIPH